MSVAMLKRMIGLFGAVWLAGCGEAPSNKGAEVEEIADDRRIVCVVNYPLKFFVERIAGDRVDVRFAAPMDEDPAYWVPDADTVAAIQKADLILLNGAGYAKWVNQVSLPAARIVNTGKALADRWIELEPQATHRHGPGEPHAHGDVAFTTWLDPTLAIEQARAVKDALTKMLPDHTLRFSEAFYALETDLLAIDRQIDLVLSKNREQPVVFSHPVYQYFEQRYGLKGKSVHWEPDEAPSGEMWNELKQLLIQHPARVMIWENTPAQATVAGLLDLGVESVVFFPCGTTPDSGDFLSVMRHNTESLEGVYDALFQASGLPNEAPIPMNAR